jgi:hypothetical protein
MWSYVIGLILSRILDWASYKPIFTICVTRATYATGVATLSSVVITVVGVASQTSPGLLLRDVPPARTMHGYLILLLTSPVTTSVTIYFVRLFVPPDP